ncbi:MAG: class I SAM-dependent methyltransferase [Gammaproteobacteria bacterium]|nr:class I SAM-dependent methyltransferase [Gammaproteobacteria bacterium]
MKNPHFDDNRVIWKNAYSGLYQPVEYSIQFDLQWRLFLEQKSGFTKLAGVETDDAWIDDRVFDLTGVSGMISDDKAAGARGIGGRQKLDLNFSANHFENKHCLDAACGAGRWTKTLMSLGARVKSIDVSEAGLESVKRFNQDVEKLDIFQIKTRPDLQSRFDFTICWGVVMCTHDPKLAFDNVAASVKNGGELYVMVYAPTYHSRADILQHRLHYHTKLKTNEERLAYAYEIADRPENVATYLDMLNTTYNWVVEEETIHGWFHNNGFSEVITLNVSEKFPVAYHVLGRKREFMKPQYDDLGNSIAEEIDLQNLRIVDIDQPIRSDQGHAWYVKLANYESEADSEQNLYRSRLILLEDGRPLSERHCNHNVIREKGDGRYSHWRGGLLFSTSDNSDPTKNGRHYQLAFLK